MLANSLQSCPTLLRHYGLYPTRLLCPWDSPGNNTGVGCLVLLQGVFPTQGLNPCLLRLLHYRWILYCCATGESPLKEMYFRTLISAPIQCISILMLLAQQSYLEDSAVLWASGIVNAIACLALSLEKHLKKFVRGCCVGQKERHCDLWFPGRRMGGTDSEGVWDQTCGCLVTKSCLTLGGRMDCSPLGSLVHSVLQARMLEWVAISLSKGSSQPRDWTLSFSIGR